MTYTVEHLRELQDKIIQYLRPATNPVALKYCKTEDELLAIPNIEYFQAPSAYVCGAITIPSYFEKTVAVRGQDCEFDYCAICNGLKPRDELWEQGQYMANFPTKWFDTLEDSKKHTEARKPCCPEGLHAIVSSTLGKGDILEPDVVCISLQPGAAFYLFAGLLHRGYQKLDFTFVGESTCADTWNRTYLTGKPGLSLGCRGDRSSAALNADEVRVTLTVSDLEKAVDGMTGIYGQGAPFGINYPFYPMSGYPMALIPKDMKV